MKERQLLQAQMVKILLENLEVRRSSERKGKSLRKSN
jgi:hypothetical protein